MADRLHDEVIPRLFAAITHLGEGADAAKRQQAVDWIGQSMDLVRQVMAIAEGRDAGHDCPTGAGWIDIAKSHRDDLPHAPEVGWPADDPAYGWPPIYQQWVGDAVGEAIRNAVRHDAATWCDVVAKTTCTGPVVTVTHPAATSPTPASHTGNLSRLRHRGEALGTSVDWRWNDGSFELRLSLPSMEVRASGLNPPVGGRF